MQNHEKSYTAMVFVAISLLLLLQSCSTPNRPLNSTGTIDIPAVTPSNVPIVTETIKPTRTSTPGKTVTPKLESTFSVSNLTNGTYLFFVGYDLVKKEESLYVASENGSIEKIALIGWLVGRPKLSYNYRFLSLTTDDGVFVFDLQNKSRNKLASDDCGRSAWAPEQLQVAIPCPDGLHFFSPVQDRWVDERFIPRVGQAKKVPSIYELLINYPLWLHDDEIAFFSI